MSAPSILYFTNQSKNQIFRRTWILSVTDGPDKNAVVHHGQASGVLGATSASLLPLTDDTVSRYHAELELSAEGILVRDLDSTNGTFYEDAPVKEIFVQDGESFQLGNTKLLVQSRDEAIESEVTALVQAPDKLLMAAPGAFVAQSNVYVRLVAMAHIVAPSRANVLLTGATGTGKNELARFIHESSGRGETHMLTLAVPTKASIAAMNGALFGVGPGAAKGQMPGPGLLERASGGSLYIEHLDRLPASTRSQLRSALHSGVTHRVGETEQRRVDVRLITATTFTDLTQTDLTANALRHLASVQLRIPDLSERPKDVYAFAELALRNADESKAWVGPRFAAALKAKSWKQNIDSLRTTLSWLHKHPLDADPLQQARVADQVALSRGDITNVARGLKVSTQALFRYLARHDIDVDEAVQPIST
jgi:transcriptional regulator of acetoin/glycerol metabolism